MTRITACPLDWTDTTPARQSDMATDGKVLENILKACSVNAPALDARGIGAHGVVLPRMGPYPSKVINDIPGLAAPPGFPEVADMIVLLRLISAKSQDLQLRNISAYLQRTSRSIDENTAQQLGRIDAWIKKTAEAEPGFWAKLFGWAGRVAATIGAVAGVVVTVCATVATGSAGAPLLAIATMALVSAVVSLADYASQSCGGGRISIGKALSDLSTNVLQACGVAPEQAKEWGKGLAGAIALAIPIVALVEPQLLGNVAGALAKLAGAGPEAAQYIEMAVGIIATVAVGVVLAVLTYNMASVLAATQTISAVHRATNTVSAVSALTQGGAALGEGGTTVQTAFVQKKADDAIANRKSLQGTMMVLQHEMRIERDIAAKVYQQISAGTKTLSRLVSNAADNHMQVLNNLSGQRGA